MNFKGTIVITDPKYVTTNSDACICCDKLGDLGFTSHETAHTVFSDSTFTILNTDSNEQIGKFKAVSGMMSVFLLTEVLNYNPAFNQDLEKITIIENFDGVIEFIGSGDELSIVGTGTTNFKSV